MTTCHKHRLFNSKENTMKHAKLKESLTLTFSETARRMKHEGKPIISLGLGEPAFPTPSEISDETIIALKEGYTRYSDAAGLPELRTAIAEKLNKENNIRCTKDNIIITPGAKQALYITLLALLEPEDEVINILPCYVSYLPQIYLAEPKAKIINIDLDKETLTLPKEKIKAATREKTKVIIINSPHNPTGKVYSKEELTWISDWAKENDIWIISDEVYEKLLFSNEEHHSIASTNNKTITINGLSKTYSMTGWRIGYLCAPSLIIPLLKKIQQHINTNTCTFIQRGSCKAFSLPETFLSPFIEQLRINNNTLRKMIEQNEKLSYVQPAGSFFAFVNIKNTNKTSDNFATELLTQKGVATTPGIAFGWDDHIRISLAQDKATFTKGIKLIDEFTRAC
jgi:aspartate aminotransferase